MASSRRNGSSTIFWFRSKLKCHWRRYSITSRLKDDGVYLADTNEEAFTEEIKSAVDEWKEKITSGDVDVPVERVSASMGLLQLF